MKYREIMERLTVSEEMQRRVTENVLSAPSETRSILRFSNAKRYLTLAACLVFLIVGAIAVTHMRGNPPVDGVQTAWGTIQYENAKDLSVATGLEIRDLRNLPFVPTETIYQKYDDDLAEILYMGDDDQLCYRVSKGSEDNSGDYTEYSSVYVQKINGISMTLKGEGGVIHCVLFEQNGCSYSLSSEQGLTQRQIETIL